MRKTLAALLLAAALPAALPADALAKGNGGRDQREALKAALAEARERDAERDSRGGFGFFGLFSDEEMDTAEAETPSAPAN